MSDTFFGFDTSLPAIEKDELLRDDIRISEDISDNEVDEKNEETFGADAESPIPTRQETEILSNGRGKSIKDILTQEYQKSNEVVSFEEEMQEEEIIENSISQLGLDDDADEEEETRSHPYVDDNASWTVPVPGTPQRDATDNSSTIQDILSPDKRGIWTSPNRSETSSSTPPKGAKEDDQPDLLKQLFNSANRNRFGNEVRTGNVNVIKAEDIEKGIPPEQSNMKGQAAPVIIERRMPRTPVAPPGFPFPMGTPPSGLPWIPPPGVIPFPPMMMTPQMQRMLASSPNMGILRNMPNPIRFPPGPMPDMNLRMHGPSVQRGRYQQWGPGNTRFQGNGQRRQFRNNQDNYNNRSPQSRQWTNNEDNVIKIAPSDLMTSREKEWLVKIQLMNLMTDDPQNKDYYYVNYMDKKASKMEEDISDDEKAKSDANKENFNRLLDIVEQKREERKYRPAAFEGSLGKPSLATVNHPRKLVDVVAKEQDDEDLGKPKSNDGIKRRFTIYATIEKAFAILLEIENINRKLLDVPDLESDDLIPERSMNIESLFTTMKLSLDNWKKESVNGIFIQMMCIPKGKKLFLRALQYFNKTQLQCAILSVMSHIQIITKKDAQEKALLPFIEIFKTTLLEADMKFLICVLSSLISNKLSQLFLYSFGLELAAIVIESVYSKSKDSEHSENIELNEYSGVLEKEATSALSQISVKSRERHLVQISRIETLLQKPEMTHAVEE